MLRIQRMLVMTLLALLVAVFSLPVLAMDLNDARRAGLVGEKPDGYIAAVKSTAETSALVEEVNARRKAEYQRISAENGQKVDVVARLAAQQVIQGLEPGSFYQAADGSWKKR